MDTGELKGFANPRNRRVGYLAVWAIYLVTAPLLRATHTATWLWAWWCFAAAASAPFWWELDIANDVLRDAYPEDHERWGWQGFWQVYLTRYLKMQWFLAVPGRTHSDPRIRGASLNFRLAWVAMVIVGLTALWVLQGMP